MQLVRMLKYFQKEFMFIFAHEHIKKGPQKLLIIAPKPFFHSTGLAAQTSPELIFHIIDMSQDSSILLICEKDGMWNISCCYSLLWTSFYLDDFILIFLLFFCDFPKFRVIKKFIQKLFQWNWYKICLIALWKCFIGLNTLIFFFVIVNFGISKKYFSNFSCVFLNPNNFFQF